VRVVLFLIAFVSLVASFWGMALAFSTPGLGLPIFLGATLLSLACLAIPTLMRD
jgi:hypothetical protein